MQGKIVGTTDLKKEIQKNHDSIPSGFSVPNRNPVKSEETTLSVMVETNNKKQIINAEMVRKYLCPVATDKEIYMFLRLCEAQNLNPFLREIYLVKYSSSAPANYVVGKETFLKRAYRNPKFVGFEAGVEGDTPDTLIGWAKVYVDGYKYPIEARVDFREYKGSGPLWISKPRTMIRKVAVVQAFREAFPEELGGLYEAGELNAITEELPKEPIVLNNEEKQK